VLAHTLNELIILVINPSPWESSELINCETPNFSSAFEVIGHFHGGIALKQPAIYHCVAFSPVDILGTFFCLALALAQLSHIPRDPLVIGNPK
jgi:hypothetical protein